MVWKILRFCGSLVFFGLFETENLKKSANKIKFCVAVGSKLRFAIL